MKPVVLLISLFLHCACIFGQQLEPIAKTTGKLTITVDPRIELLSAVQLISDYTKINRKTEYSDEMIQFFSRYNNHEAVKLTNQLANEYDFNYDAPIDLMLRLSQVPELKKIHTYPDRLTKRSNGENNLNEYRKAMHDFAVKSNFKEFWNNKIPYYQKMVKYTVDDLGNYDPVVKLEEYYNESKNSYNVALSPSLSGGYNIRILSANKNYDSYACLEPYELKDSIPFLSQLELSHFIWHEFSHSFVNPLSEKHKAKIDSLSGLFNHFEKELREKTFGNWTICVNEHIIRAIYIRLLNKYEGENAAKTKLDIEKALHYVYVEPLVEKLKQFEVERQTKGTTFSDYFPKLLDVFDSLSHSNVENFLNPPFQGPISSILVSRKIAIIYPTNDKDTVALTNLVNYVSAIQKMKGEVSTLFADTIALKTNLTEYDIMAYGTIESNLFLNKHKDAFPFKISGDTIFTNTKHVGQGLRIITCLPNPYNNKKGIMVNSATRNRSIKRATNSFTNDYIVFEDIENILQQGLYRKG